MGPNCFSFIKQMTNQEIQMTVWEGKELTKDLEAMRATALILRRKIRRIEKIGLLGIR